MKIRVVVLQPLRRRLKYFCRTRQFRRLILKRRQFCEALVELTRNLGEHAQTLAIEHPESATLFRCHAVANCPAVFSNSSCACCFWKFASRYAIHVSFSSSLAFSTSRRFGFPSANCACSTATFCCASCNSTRATSFAASLSLTRLLYWHTAA